MAKGKIIPKYGMTARQRKRELELRERLAQVLPDPKGDIKRDAEAKAELKYFMERHKKHFGNKTGKGNVSDVDNELYKRTQAQRVVHRFGGTNNLIRLVKDVYPDYKLGASTVRRWQSAKCVHGGIIPANHMYMLLRLSRLHGLILTPEDCFPGRL